MYKLGIDVGGTNTDAVLMDENRAVVADIKHPTSADIYDGILGAMRTVLEVSGVDPHADPSGNAGYHPVHQRHCGAQESGPHRHPAHRRPATTGIRPMVDWSEDIQRGRGQHHHRRRL